MAAGFKSPFFLLGFGALAVMPAGFASPLFFLGLGGFEEEAVESPPVVPEEMAEEEMPANPSTVRRCTASPWWPGTFERGVYGWEHTRMDLVTLCDFYWAAQGLTIEGEMSSNLAAGRFAGSNFLEIEPHELLIYQPRFCEGLQTVSDGNYSVTGNYVFSQPLHWDGLNSTFCPEMAVTISIGHHVTPGQPEDLGEITIDPNVPGAIECGTAYLLRDLRHGLELPLYYRPGILTHVSAEVILTAQRWRF